MKIRGKNIVKDVKTFNIQYLFPLTEIKYMLKIKMEKLRLIRNRIGLKRLRNLVKSNTNQTNKTAVNDTLIKSKYLRIFNIISL